jgi:hypothetical protein
LGVLAAVAVPCWNHPGLTSVMAESVMPQAQRWVDLQRWIEGGLEHALPSTPEAIAAALYEVAGDWSVELIVEVGDPGLRGRVPGNPKLIVSACEGRLAVGALIAPERAVYYLVGDQPAVGEVAFTFGGQPGGTWPRRYLVDVDHAIAVAQDFLATGAVEQSTGPRDRASW